MKLIDWTLAVFDRIPPETRRRAAVIVLFLTLIGWPISLVTFRDEPPFILSLSWLALTITAIDVIISTDVRKQQEDAPSDADVQEVHGGVEHLDQHFHEDDQEDV